MTTPFNPERGTEHYEPNEGASVFDDQSTDERIPHGGEGVVHEYGRPLGEVDPRAHEVPTDPSTMPENLPPLDRTVIPPKEHRDSKLLPWYKKPAAKVAAATLAIGAAFGGGAIAFGGGEDEPKTDPTEVSTDEKTVDGEGEPGGHDVANSEDPTTQTTSTFEDESATPTSTEQASENDAFNPPLYMGEGGFLIPTDQPEVYTSFSQLEFYQPETLSQALKQSNSVLNYIVNTGDTSAIDYVANDTSGEFSEAALGVYDKINYYGDYSWGFEDVQNWIHFDVVNPEDGEIRIDDLKDGDSFEIRQTEVLYDAFYEDYGPLYEKSGLQTMTIDIVEVANPSSNDGEMLTIPVMRHLTQITDVSTVDPSDLLNDDGTAADRYPN